MNLDQATLVIVDTETGGTDPEKDELLEIGAVAIDLFHAEPVAMFSRLVKPEKPIPAEVSAIHGLTRELLHGGVTREIAMRGLEHFIDLHEYPIVVAHNAAFDRSFLQADRWPWLCTMRIAKHIWKDAPNYKNQTLRYWRYLDVETFGIPPHRALGDALVTAALVRDELTCPEFAGDVQRHLWQMDAIIEWSESPIVLPAWPFGKFFGEPISAADAGYIEWALGPRGVTDMDTDLRFTLETEIAKRSQQGAA